MRFVVPSVDLRAYRPDHAVTKLLTKEFCTRNAIVPVSTVRGVLIVAVVEPENQAATIAEVEARTGLKVEVVRASAEEIELAIATCYGGLS